MEDNANKITNAVRISLCCKLAHKRVEEEAVSEIIEDESGYQTIYTEIGQDLFNEYYDYYESVLLSELD